jgi:hypothetical protein
MYKNLSDIINNYKKGYIDRRELLKHINQIILNVPSYFKCYDKDVLHDFYAMIISKIDKILSGYENINHASFKTWFTKVLKINFITYIRMRNEKTAKEFQHELFYHLFKEFPVNGEDVECYENNDVSIFDFLSYNEKAVLSYKFGFNFIEDNDSSSARIILEKMEKRKKVELKIEKRYFKLISLQRKICETQNEEIRRELMKEEKIQKEFKKKLENKYKNFNILPSNKWVASKMGWQEGTVAAYLSRIKTKILKKINCEGSIFGDKVKNSI